MILASVFLLIHSLELSLLCFYHFSLTGFLLHYGRAYSNLSSVSPLILSFMPPLPLLRSWWIFNFAVARVVCLPCFLMLFFLSAASAAFSLQPASPCYFRLLFYWGHASSCSRCQTAFENSYFAVIVTNSMILFLLSCFECFPPSGLLLDSVCLLMLWWEESQSYRGSTAYWGSVGLPLGLLSIYHEISRSLVSGLLLSGVISALVNSNNGVLKPSPVGSQEAHEKARPVYLFPLYIQWSPVSGLKIGHGRSVHPTGNFTNQNFNEKWIVH
jgi:hypothetical protein